MGLSREVLEDLSTERFQENVARELSRQSKSKALTGCISGEKTLIAENKWRVYHSLGIEPSGFVIIAQGSSSSILAKMENVTSENVEISFNTDPTSFTLFFF